LTFALPTGRNFQKDKTMSRHQKYATSIAAFLAAAPLALAQPLTDERGAPAPAEKADPRPVGPSESGAQEKEDRRDAGAGRKDTTKDRRESKDSDAGKAGRDRAKDDENRNQRSPDERARTEDKNKDRTGKNSEDAAKTDVREDAERKRDARQKADGDNEQRSGQNKDQGSGDRREPDDGRERASGDITEEGRQKAEAVRSKVDDGARQRVREAAARGDLRRADNVDIRVRAGIRLPRRVAIYDLPPDIIAIAPAYRGYHYIVIGDDYCIVDPATYVIVDVIPVGGSSRAEYAYRPDGGTAGLSLTEEQIEVIRRGVRDRGRNFDFDGDLEIGAVLPGDFALEPFPETIVSEVPVVKDYRFVHVEDDIAIVSPDKSTVMFVIED
jgi:hypothetical protein